MGKNMPDDEGNGGELVPAEGGDGEGMGLVYDGGGLASAGIDIQISTAQRYPRNVQRSLKSAIATATMSEEMAGRCFYTMPRKAEGGRSVNITGPSIRLAEILYSEWGNMHAGKRVCGDDGQWVEAEAVVWDLEKNNRFHAKVRRRIVNKKGIRYSEDMIQVTGAAAASIAFRNATFTVVPRLYVEEVERSCRKLVAGDIKTFPRRREETMSWWEKRGVPRANLLARLGRAEIEEVTTDDFLTLRGILTAITDGITTQEAAFPPPGAGPEAKPLDLGSIRRPKVELAQGSTDVATTEDHPKQDPGKVVWIRGKAVDEPQQEATGGEYPSTAFPEAKQGKMTQPRATSAPAAPAKPKPPRVDTPDESPTRDRSWFLRQIDEVSYVISKAGGRSSDIVDLDALDDCTDAELRLALGALEVRRDKEARTED